MSIHVPGPSANGEATPRAFNLDTKDQKPLVWPPFGHGQKVTETQQSQNGTRYEVENKMKLRHLYIVDV